MGVGSFFKAGWGPDLVEKLISYSKHLLLKIKFCLAFKFHTLCVCTTLDIFLKNTGLHLHQEYFFEQPSFFLQKTKQKQKIGNLEHKP